MASEIVSNNHQIVALDSKVEDGKIAITEDNYLWDGESEFYTHFTHHYYKTSSDVRNTTVDYITLEELVEELVSYANAPLDYVEEWFRLFLETI